MYCKCDKRKPVKSHVFGEAFQVCSKRLGGCGCEIKDTEPHYQYGWGYGLEGNHPTECKDCHGTGLVAIDSAWGSFNLNCATCNAKGYK